MEMFRTMIEPHLSLPEVLERVQTTTVAARLVLARVTLSIADGAGFEKPALAIRFSRLARSRPGPTNTNPA
jgi:hypothetical protein